MSVQMSKIGVSIDLSQVVQAAENGQRSAEL